MQRTTVVAETKPLTKAQLHAKLMRGWARGIDRHGKGAFADELEVSGTALDKQLAGSLPSFETIDKALDAEPTVLDDYFAAKGKRVVDANAVCDADDAGVLITRILLWLQESQHPDSPGGRSIVHSELLPAEFMIRQLHTATGNWIESINSHRRGTDEAA